MTNAIYMDYINEVINDEIIEKAIDLDKKYNLSYEYVRDCMSREERVSKQDECALVMDTYFYGTSVDKKEYELAYNLYFRIEAVEDAIYFEENYESFKAYEAKMNEPDFDWDFYSDWHKDMYGFRPR